MSPFGDGAYRAKGKGPHLRVKAAAEQVAQCSRMPERLRQAELRAFWGIRDEADFGPGP